MPWSATGQTSQKPVIPMVRVCPRGPRSILQRAPTCALPQPTQPMLRLGTACGGTPAAPLSASLRDDKMHTQNRTVRALDWALVIALAAGCCAQALGQASRPAPGVADAVRACSALAQQTGAALNEPTARILTAKLNPRSESKADPAAPPWMGPLPAMPEHCEVIGVMRERTGSDGQRYAVKFHMRLPRDWNGRFLFQGGGGTNGVLGAGNGSLQPGMPTGLEQGFAVVSTDTGHDNATNSDGTKQGTVAFGHDYQARLEYSEKALDSVATTAKRIVRIYYGRPARHSFFAGCSNGGREGMVFAQRFPQQFD